MHEAPRGQERSQGHLLLGGVIFLCHFCPQALLDNTATKGVVRCGQAWAISDWPCGLGTPLDLHRESRVK